MLCLWELESTFTCWIPWLPWNRKIHSWRPMTSSIKQRHLKNKEIPSLHTLKQLLNASTHTCENNSTARNTSKKFKISGQLRKLYNKRKDFLQFIWKWIPIELANNIGNFTECIGYALSNFTGNKHHAKCITNHQNRFQKDGGNFEILLKANQIIDLVRIDLIICSKCTLNYFHSNQKHCEAYCY